MTNYEEWCQIIAVISDENEKNPVKRDIQNTVYLGLIAKNLARIADALEGKNAASKAEYNRGKNEGLEEAMQRMSNMGFCQTADYYYGVGDAIKICKDIQRETKGAENAAD